MNSQCARRAILDDIATDPSAPQQQRAEARRALRSARSSTTQAINRTLAHARRRRGCERPDEVYTMLRNGLPPMDAARREAVSRELARILGI
ncbi:MAG: hypothetical protein H6642_00060 [Caldilineaceae bacterium]|nr:hypothetical protein [Caldilineaceae bacterium]